MEGWYISSTVLAGLWVVPLAVLWFLSFCLARRKQDPARVGITWIKVAYPLFVLALILHTITGGLRLVQYYGNLYGRDSPTSVQQAVSHIAITAEFLRSMGDIVLFIAFVELARGFLLCLGGSNEPSPKARTSRIAIFAWAFVLFAVCISYFGFAHSTNATYFNRLSSASGNLNTFLATQRDFNTVYRLEGALRILLWLTSLVILALASVVIHRVKGNDLLRKAASLFLVATIFDVIRHLVLMAIFADQVLAHLGDNLGRSVGQADLAVRFVVEPFFNFVFLFVLLVLLFVLAIRKRGGLWAHPRPEWNYPPVVYMPHYAVAVPVHAAPMPGAPMQHPPPPPQGGAPPGTMGHQPQPQMHPQQMQHPQQQQQYGGAMPAYLQFAQQKQMQEQMQQQQQPQQQQPPQQ